MKAGVIGIPDRDFGAIDPVQETITQDGYDLTRCIEIRQSLTGVNDSGQIQTGRAAVQRIDDGEAIEISDGRIVVTEQPEITTRYTEFISVPGQFIAVSNGGGTFAFDLIGQNVNASIERAEFDLDGFADEYPDATPWKVGFYGHVGNAENGVLHGEGVFEDSDFGGAVRDAQKNQLGLNLAWGNETVKMMVSESGYVEVYQPSSYDTAEFSEFVMDSVLDHT